MKLLTSLLLTITALSLATPQAHAYTDLSDFVGTWKYTSQEAPYEYQQGKFLIAKKDGKPTVKVVFSNNAEREARDIELKDGQLTFSLYVEGTYITVKLERKDDKITGVADTPDGKVHLTAVKSKN